MSSIHMFDSVYEDDYSANIEPLYGALRDTSNDSTLLSLIIMFPLDYIQRMFL